MNNIYKLLLIIAVLTVTIGCEHKCDEDDFIGFKMTQDKFFYTTNIFATKVDNVTKINDIVASEKVTIIAYGNNLTVTPKKPLTPSNNDVVTPDTKFSPAWNYQLFNIDNAYPADYDVACGLELCCYSCEGIENMSFDNTNEFKAKIDNDSINDWYVYYNNSWWQWDVTKAQINWGTLAPANIK